MTESSVGKIREKTRDQVYELTEYKKLWTETATARGYFKAAVPKAKPKAKGKAKGGPAPPPPPPRVLDGDLAQATLKPLCPPDSHIWRMNTKGSWGSRYSDSPVHSASWQLYGHRESALMCLRNLWLEYLFANGKSEVDCTVEGLFGD